MMPKVYCDTLAIPDPTKAVPADREFVLRRKIIPPILMHKPHPRKELLEYQVKQLTQILEQEGLL